MNESTIKWERGELLRGDNKTFVNGEPLLLSFYSVRGSHPLRIGWAWHNGERFCIKDESDMEYSFSRIEYFARLSPCDEALNALEAESNG